MRIRDAIFPSETKEAVPVARAKECGNYKCVTITS